MPTVNADAALSGGAYLRMTVTEGTQDVAANTSEDSWSLTLYKGSFSSFNLDGVGYSASVNGSVVSSGSYTFDFRSSTSKLIASGTVTVTHNADGTKTTAFSGYTDATVTSSGGPATASGNLVQTTIPRATVPTLSNSSRQIGQSTTITLDRASSSFTHDISYAFGSLTGQTSGLSASSGVATSATFTVPQALVSEMVGQSSKPLTFTVVTKSGATVIGSKTVQLTVTPAGGTVYQRPTVAATVIRALSDGTPADDGVCAKVTIDAAVTSVLVSTEQNTLTWKTEVSANSGSTWQQLGTGTVASHGLTLSAATTYTDSDPGTGGTQSFATTSGFLFRVTITDAYSNAAVQVVAMTTAAAILDIYSEPGEPVGLAIGALYDPGIGSRFQVDGAPYGMRLGFANDTARAAFTGWPGLVAYTESNNYEHLWVTSWQFWARPATSWVPTFSNLTLGNGTVAGRYAVAGGVCSWELQITFGSTTSVGDLSFTLPFTPAQTTAYQWRGDVTFIDASAGTAGRLAGRVVQFASSTARVMALTSPGGAIRHDAITSSIPISSGFAVSDQILMNGSYIL